MYVKCLTFLCSTLNKLTLQSEKRFKKKTEIQKVLNCS